MFGVIHKFDESSCSDKWPVASTVSLIRCQSSILFGVRGLATRLHVVRALSEHAFNFASDLCTCKKLIAYSNVRGLSANINMCHEWLVWGRIAKKDQRGK
jgi:hypothetical protein